MVLPSYIERLAAHYQEKEEKEVVVFIDTNPALSIYTHTALVAMSQLTIPVNADCFSMEVTRVTLRIMPWCGVWPASVLLYCMYCAAVHGDTACMHACGRQAGRQAGSSMVILSAHSMCEDALPQGCQQICWQRCGKFISRDERVVSSWCMPCHVQC
jgi:hypothetical protein